MKITKFISSLLPSMNRSDIKEDLATLNKELQETTLPAYITAVEQLAERDFTDDRTREFDKLFEQRVNKMKGRNHIVHIHHTLKELEKTVVVLNKMVDKHFATKIARESMTYLRAEILRYIAAATFVVKYSRRHLHYVLICEINAKDGRTHALGKELSKAELEWLRENARGYMDALNSLSDDSKAVEKSLKAIPDAVISEERNEAVEATVGKRKLDPFRLGFLPPRFNIIYLIGMRVAEYQANRLRAAKEEAKALEYRLLELRQVEEGERDAKLQQLIEYTEDRVRKLNYKIKKAEEDYDV